jgi:hypothetical protein
LTLAKFFRPQARGGLTSCRIEADARRESLGAIRSFLIDSDRSNAFLRTACAKLFCAAFKPHCIDIATNFAALFYEFHSCARNAYEYRRCEKTFVLSCFVQGPRFALDDRKRVARNASSHRIDAMRCHRARCSHVRRTHFVKWSRCFFRCAVVKQVQCVSIRERTEATSAMLHG